jgi:hypothetical protein
MGEHNCYQSDARECIQKKAFVLWEKDGRKAGRDLDYWLLAEKTVHAPSKKVKRA